MEYEVPEINDLLDIAEHENMTQVNESIANAERLSGTL